MSRTVELLHKIGKRNSQRFETCFSSIKSSRRLNRYRPIVPMRGQTPIVHPQLYIILNRLRSHDTTKTFLVVEDSADDAALIRRAFADVASCQAFVCRNLSEGRAYVQGAGMYGDRHTYPFPNAVISDLRVGGESGVEFVAWLKTNIEFAKIPVIVLTGSATDKDLIAAKKNGAIDALRKPARFEDLKALLADLAAKLCPPEVQHPPARVASVLAA